jgi:hypothetical protein
MCRFPGEQVVTGLYWTAAVLAAVSAGASAVRLRRDRSVLVMLSVSSMACGGASMALVARWPELLQPAPADAIAGWLTISLGVVAAWGFAGLLALMAGETTHPAAFVAIPSAIAILSGLVPAAARQAGDAPPWSIPELATQCCLLACLCPAQVRIGFIARRFSRRIRVRHLRLGMRAVAAGAAASLALILARAALIGGSLAGSQLPGSATGTVSAAQGAAAIAMVAGMTASAWARPVSRLLRQAWFWSAWWQLRPLRAALRRAVPEVTSPGVRLSIRYRLDRRVLEIRDAQLAVRRYCAPEVPGRAEDAAKSAGLDSAKLAAVVEAAVIASGAGARLRGSAPLGTSVPVAGPVEPPRDDLRAEAARLIEVSRAFRRSAVVRLFRQAGNRAAEAAGHDGLPARSPPAAIVSGPAPAPGAFQQRDERAGRRPGHGCRLRQVTGPAMDHGGESLGIVFLSRAVDTAGTAAEYRLNEPGVDVRGQHGGQPFPGSCSAIVAEQHVGDLVENDMGAVVRGRPLLMKDVVNPGRADPHPARSGT